MEKELLQVFLPEIVAEDFEVVKITKTAETLELICEEKLRIPERTEAQRKKGIISKGFQSIQVQDFPVRGRSCTLILKRRVWQVKGEPALLMNNYGFVATGTKLVKEFGDFLKEGD